MTTQANETSEVLRQPADIKKIGLINWLLKFKDSMVAANQQTDELSSRRTDEALASLTKAKPADLHTIAASQINVLSSHYEMVLKQAQKTFKAAKFALVAGALFFTVAVMMLMAEKNQAILIISFAGGVLVETIAGINFYFYWKTVSLLKGFHFRIDRIQSYLLANSMCESLDGEAQTASRQELIRRIAFIADPGSCEPEVDGKLTGDPQGDSWKY